MDMVGILPYRLVSSVHCGCGGIGRLVALSLRRHHVREAVDEFLALLQIKAIVRLRDTGLRV